MMGKLHSVDCVVEVHDARIPMIGRNREFREHLGKVKPHILVLNKIDLADLSRWDVIEKKLRDQGDSNVILTDLSGSQFSQQGYQSLLQRAVTLMRDSDRHNRELTSEYKIMIVGIPNVGKSTLINRLRQHHLGRGGEAAKTGKQAGVTRVVENKIRICSRPLIYTLDTPGVLQPSATRNHDQAMKLALCSTINDKVIEPMHLADFLLGHLNRIGNHSYVDVMGLSNPETNIHQLCRAFLANQKSDASSSGDLSDHDGICWHMIKLARLGCFGKLMFS